MEEPPITDITTVGLKRRFPNSKTSHLRQNSPLYPFTTLIAEVILGIKFYSTFTSGQVFKHHLTPATENARRQLYSPPFRAGFQCGFYLFCHLFSFLLLLSRLGEG